MFRFFTCFTQHTHGRTRPKLNMPPKKKAKTLQGQQKLTFSAFSNSNEHHRRVSLLRSRFFLRDATKNGCVGDYRRVSAGDFVPLAAEAAQASAIDSAPSSNNLSTASNQTKARKFFSSWMKTYSWLAYDEKRRLYVLQTLHRTKEEKWNVQSGALQEFPKHNARQTCCTQRSPNGFAETADTKAV